MDIRSLRRPLKDPYGQASSRMTLTASGYVVGGRMPSSMLRQVPNYARRCLIDHPTSGHP